MLDQVSRSYGRDWGGLRGVCLGFASSPVVGDRSLQRVIDGDHTEEVPSMVDDGEHHEIEVGHAGGDIDDVVFW